MSSRDSRLRAAAAYIPDGTDQAQKIRLYNAWRAMLNRCYRKKDKDYADYGGRGITVCKRWKDKRKGFANFLADMGVRPNGMSLDRIDNTKDYSPENCRWATWKEQHRNRRDTRLLTHEGRTMCLSAWAEETGISKSVIRERLNRGLSSEQVLSLVRLRGKRSAQA